MSEYGILSFGGLSSATSAYEMGWYFKVGSEDITISALRAYFPNIQTQNISLWNGAGQLLRRVEITSIANEWVEGAITPIVLLANNYYLISAYTEGGRYYKQSYTFTFNPKISFFLGAYGNAKDAFPQNTSSDLFGLVDIVVSTGPSYKPSGTYQTPLIEMSEPLRIKWLENKPAGTNIIVKYSTQETPTLWVEVNNLDVISGNSNIYLQINLITTDNSATPTLSSIWLEKPNIQQDKLLINIKDNTPFNNVAGNITVKYDETKGNLKGEGGVVKSFTKAFLPADLVEKSNPRVHEYINVNINGTEIILKKIEKITSLNKEYINANIDGTSIILFYIEPINP